MWAPQSRAPTLTHRDALAERTGNEKTPAVYIRGRLVSGADLKQASQSGELSHWTDDESDGASPRET